MPEGWAWSRLEPVATVITDYVANGSFASLKANVRTYKDKNYALFVRTIDFAKKFSSDLSYIDEESYKFLEKSKLFGGELMLSNIGASIGKVFKVPKFEMPMSLAPNSIVLRFVNDITTDYFEYVFKSFVGQDYLQFLSGGAAMPKFNKTDLRAMIVPLAPLQEQYKIVEAVNNITVFIDKLENSFLDLSSVIQNVKSKILDLAIRGKLVPQNPDDEPASVLLERIRAEKEELIKQGKIKRDKKESVIFKGEDNSYYERIDKNVINITDEIPFAIPERWSFIRLEDVLEYEQPTPYIVESTDYKNEYPTPVLTAGKSFIIGYTNETTGIKTDLPVIIFDDFTTESKYVDFPFKVKSSAMKILAPNEKSINIKYAFYAMQCVECDNYNHKRYWISEFSKKLIPLPPLEEQCRIVQTVEELYQYIDASLN